MPRITIITPSVRVEGLLLVERALTQQTFRDFEWIIAAPDSEEMQMYQPSFLVTWLRDPERRPEDVWTLNKAYNQALKKAEGELIVSWQDHTYAGPNALKRFWSHYELDQRIISSGVGNKYADETWKEKTWQDPRQRSDLGSVYPCNFEDIEANLCAWPTEALYAVGGFMEDLDALYGMDAFCVNDRLNELATWDFRLDQGLESFSLEHGRPTDWEEKNWIHGGRYWAKKEDLRREGKWPVAPYLQR
jgi:hypothetical protein